MKPGKYTLLITNHIKETAHMRGFSSKAKAIKSAKHFAKQQEYTRIEILETATGTTVFELENVPPPPFTLTDFWESQPYAKVR